jgi:hypothetical protein
MCMVFVNTWHRHTSPKFELLEDVKYNLSQNVRKVFSWIDLKCIMQYFDECTLFSSDNEIGCLDRT